MIDLSLAGAADDADLRAMLRSNPMPGWVTLSLEREPSWAAGQNRFGRERVVIARDGTTAVGMYACAEHPVHVDGRPANLGYLGGLRVNPAYRHRLRVLRAGYASIPRLSGIANPNLWYTSIAAENRPARRLLEAGLADLPRYVALGEMLTLALPKSRGKRLGRWRPIQASEGQALCRVHNASAARFQFAPVLTPEGMATTGATFFVTGESGCIDACMAIWNQQAYKQVVARAYRPALAAALPLYNAWARLARRIALPRLNQALDQSFLAFFAPGSDDAATLIPLIQDALAICPSQVLTFGCHAAHPALPALLRTFKPALYRTVVYAVCFDSPPAWDARPVQPEVAIL
ncbi:MAG: GNAT family N-acetyltransferase [Rhodocyclales bacterium GT-UBC]|nr:MAG: GNAT family N-acetyltransferase [Rhodocyclales bacterium GT-UBC]